MSLRGEDGFVAGGEALALGVVVFIVGTLLVLNAWRLVDGKLAVETAAREAVRGLVEAPVEVLVDPARSQEVAVSSARAVLVAHRGPDDAPDATWRFVGTRLQGTVARCAPLTASVTIDVSTVRVPLVPAGFGTVRLTGAHTERLEPYRSGLPLGGAAC